MQTRDTAPIAGRRTYPLTNQLRGALAARLTPERTRRASWWERHTVSRLSWGQLTRLNRYLEFIGKLTTGTWIAFIVSLVIGVNWHDLLEEAVNSGKPVEGAIALALLMPTLIFIAARSLIGFARWRIQRELWRRDVARLGDS